jgi:hypothetical protein
VAKTLLEARSANGRAVGAVHRAKSLTIKITELLYIADYVQIVRCDVRCQRSR